MGIIRRRRNTPVWILLCLALLGTALYWSSEAAVTPEPAEAHFGGSGPHCSTITSASGPGTHACHNHEADYYLKTVTRLTGCTTGGGG